MMICDTCGTQGTRDDGIEPFGECAWEWCNGTILLAPTCTGKLAMWKTEVILQSPCERDDYGNIRVVDGYKEELIDTLESRVWCSECGLLGSDEMEDHGLVEDWQEVV